MVEKTVVALIFDLTLQWYNLKNSIDLLYHHSRHIQTIQYNMRSDVNAETMNNKQKKKKKKKEEGEFLTGLRLTVRTLREIA